MKSIYLRLFTAWFWTFLTWQLSLPRAWAAQIANAALEREETESSVSWNSRTRARAEAYARNFHVLESTVLELREKGMGWGEIGHLLAISGACEQDPDAILALRQEGAGWGEIAQRFGLKLGKIRREARAAEREARRVTVAREKAETRRERTRQRAEARSERVSTRPDKPERAARNAQAELRNRPKSRL